MLDTEGSCPLPAIMSCSAGDAAAVEFSLVAALSSTAAGAPLDVCATRWTDNLARVDEEGWMFWCKNSSKSFFVSVSMLSTSR